MKATTSLGALYRAFHADGYPDHDPDECGCSDGLKRLDMGQAVRFEELLSSQGWMLVPKVSAPRSVPKGTSGRIDNVTDRMLDVLRALATSAVGFTDEELATRYQTLRLAPQTEQSIRSRRAEAVRLGLVAPCYWARGQRAKRTTSNGSTAGVWEITERGRERINEAVAA